MSEDDVDQWEHSQTPNTTSPDDPSLLHKNGNYTHLQPYSSTPRKLPPASPNRHRLYYACKCFTPLERFQALSPYLLHRTENEAQKNGVPSFTQNEFDDLQQEDRTFSGNLTYTLEDFSNVFHVDNDYNTYAYGMWVPVHHLSANLATKAKGFSCEGGHFVVSVYGVAVDFGACDGLVKIIWRAPPPTQNPYAGERNAIKIEAFLDRLETHFRLDYAIPNPDHGEAPLIPEIVSRQYVARYPGFKVDILKTCIKDGSIARTWTMNYLAVHPVPAEVLTPRIVGRIRNLKKEKAEGKNVEKKLKGIKASVAAKKTK